MSPRRSVAAVAPVAPVAPADPVAGVGGAGPTGPGAPEVVVDGRLERGRASRAAILDAAAGVIRDQGIDALTHRAVAAEARVPLARVSYHYPTVEELAVAGAGRFLDRFDERLTELAEASRVDGTIVDACAQFLVELLTEGRAEFVAALQVRIAMHRRGVVVEDQRILGLIGSFGASDTTAASIFAALFGYATLVATGPDPVDAGQVRAYVRLVLESMT